MFFVIVIQYIPVKILGKILQDLAIFALARKDIARKIHLASSCEQDITRICKIL